MPDFGSSGSVGDSRAAGQSGRVDAGGSWTGASTPSAKRLCVIPGGRGSCRAAYPFAAPGLRGSVRAGGCQTMGSTCVPQMGKGQGDGRERHGQARSEWLPRNIGLAKSRFAARPPKRARRYPFPKSIHDTGPACVVGAWEKFASKPDYSRSADYTECDDNATPTSGERSASPHRGQIAQESARIQKTPGP